MHFVNTVDECERAVSYLCPSQEHKWSSREWIMGWQSWWGITKEKDAHRWLCLKRHHTDRPPSPVRDVSTAQNAKWYWSSKASWKHRGCISCTHVFIWKYRTKQQSVPVCRWTLLCFLLEYLLAHSIVLIFLCPWWRKWFCFVVFFCRDVCLLCTSEPRWS